MAKKEPEEYKLPGDEDFNDQADFVGTSEQNQDQEPLMSSRPNRFAGLLRHKKMLIGLGLIIAVIVVYEISSIGSTDQSSDREVQRTTTQTTQQTRPTSQTNNQLASLASQNQNLSSTISTLQKQSQTNKSDLSKLEGAMSQLVQNQRQLNNQMQNLTAGLQRLSLEIEKIGTKPVKKTKREVRRYTPPSPVYYLKAVLPGRAWLQSKKGQTMTVTLGDKVRGYGTVTWINAQLGQVRTSSGKIIRYGADDY